ncbi:DUF1015 domain-containing protein [Serpentinicella alkaliphila]|uniref:Uncharacterized protein (DUF1015 family) n=1 Tax=Serpentinicella alkaliphila TaxID=1734049 RepID=A0A4R2TSG3_9FIRM|nr:DUF1015 family protein [Serpentinicella alkaliphila]QUH25628.1 DUF1015 domain-containing protein [Serpentinicella alkaliphila]TCQ06661.1 uncharacterized protein (DUF1015 family) [Serpentinicella alkaliphila]
MITLKPFKAIRPQKELVEKVVSLPYDVMNIEEAKEMAKGNPYNFLHVTRAEIDIEELKNPYSEIVYKKSKENLYKMVDENILFKDKEPRFYIYRQTMNGRAQTGIVGCASVDDYLNGKIKKHEFTRYEKEIDRINHFDYCDANTEPIFLTYKKDEVINNIINRWTEFHLPEYMFNTKDGVKHILWCVTDNLVIEQIQLQFKKVDSLYIADGHHRTESAVKVALKRRAQFPNYTGQEEYNYFMTVTFPHEDLYIMDYNRVVKDLNGLSEMDFIEKVKENFLIEKVEGQFKPEKQHTFGMFLEGQWCKLEAKPETYINKDIISRLDVSILQKYLLHPILGIDDPRSNKRIDFVGGIRGLAELEQRTISDMKVAFSMYPTTIEELIEIADKGEVMPPKSTWFEPKLLSGLFIHTLDTEYLL